MLRFWKLAGVLTLAGMVLPACATMSVSSHVERGLDFTRYHTWNWAPPDALPETDARLDSAFFQDHLQGAVEKEFARRRIDRVESDPPDLLVHYHANVSPRIDVNRTNSDAGACYDENCSVRVLESEVGTILVDVLDARTGRLIWRGWAQTNVESALDNPRQLEDRINEAVTAMFKQFPRSM